MKLTIGIPTYNRSKQLDGLLNSIYIASLNEPQVKLFILISDNNSEDDTFNVVHKWKETLNINYHVNERNIGPIKNLFYVANMFNGQGYFWFMGDDDEIAEDSFKIIRSYLDIKEENIDFFILNRKICTRQMEPIKNDSFFSEKKDIHFKISNEKSFVSYLKKVNHTGGIFGLITSVIACSDFIYYLKKEIITDRFWEDNLFPHVYIILKYIYLHKDRQTVNVMYIFNTLINFRSGVLSKSSSKNLNALLDYKNLHLIAIKLFDSDKATSAYIRILRKNYSLRLFYMLQNSSSEYEREYDKNIRNIIYPCFYHKLVFICLQSLNFFVKILRLIKK